MAPTHDKERQLTREITPKVEGALPGTEVLAVELTSPERFTVGRRVALRTTERKRVRGAVVAAGEAAVPVETNGKSVDIPYEAIVRGNLIEEAGKR